MTEADVQEGKFTLHISVTPRPDISERPSASGTWFAVAEECRVDEQRRVRCVFRWLNAESLDPTSPLPVPLLTHPVGQKLVGVCGYVVLAASPSTEGGS